MTNYAYRGWPASSRRLALAIAASAGAHAAVLANTPFAPGLHDLSLLPSAPPLRARLELLPAAPSAVSAAELAQRRVEAADAAPPSGLPAPEVFHAGKDVDRRAEPTNAVDIEYPPEAFSAGTSGSVTLRLLIDYRGLLREASVIEARPPGVFEEAALKAVRALVFKPALRNGVPVGSIKLIEVPFEPDCKRTGSCIPAAEEAARRR